VVGWRSTSGAAARRGATRATRLRSERPTRDRAGARIPARAAGPPVRRARGRGERNPALPRGALRDGGRGAGPAARARRRRGDREERRALLAHAGQGAAGGRQRTPPGARRAALRGGVGLAARPSTQSLRTALSPERPLLPRVASEATRPFGASRKQRRRRCAQRGGVFGACCSAARTDLVVRRGLRPDAALRLRG